MISIYLSIFAIVTVQPSASLLRNPAHLKFAVRKGLDSLAEFTHSHGLCSRCKVLGELLLAICFSLMLKEIPYLPVCAKKADIL